MRKPMLVLAIFIIALAAAAIGPTMFQKEESPQNPQEPPVVVNQKQSLDVPKEPEQEPAAALPVTPAAEKEKAKKPELPMVQPETGEIIVEGTVTGIDTKDRVITFTQEMDDNSVQVGPEVEVLKDAIVIKSSAGKVALEAVQKGSYVTMVLDKEHRAKSVEISK